MNLLLCNDDGFDSEGIKVLAKKLSQKHKVYIVAPDSNRSAVSHHITMFKENTLIKLDDNLYSCSGFPVDCVFTGIESSLFGVKIDAVISGINRGANMGTDIIYSGTCAVARQGVLSGLPSVAFSLQSSEAEDNWEDPAPKRPPPRRRSSRLSSWRRQHIERTSLGLRSELTKFWKLGVPYWAVIVNKSLAFSEVQSKSRVML